MGVFAKSWADLKTQLAVVRGSQKVVFTNGVFDLLHVGHVRYLKEARAQGQILVVGVNSDASTKRLGKGPSRPIQGENDRAEILAALESVSFTVLFDEDTPEKLIHEVRPDVLVKGGDYDIKTIVGAEFVMSYGGDVRALQFVDGRSTTAIAKKLQL